MSLFLSGLPLWITALLIVVLPTVAASWGLIWIRRLVGLERLSANNEVAGFKFAVVGVIYAVLLAFAVIVVWERYNEAEVTVIREAGAASTLYRLAAGPNPDAVATREALSNYLQLAIERDWPEMAREKDSPEVNQALNQLYAAASRLTQGGSLPAAVEVAMFHELDMITESRRSRMHLAIGIVPVVLWQALILGGGLTVCFTFFFATPNLRAQVLMTAILSVIVFMGLFVIVSIDHPFTGPVHIHQDSLQRVLHDFVGR